MIKTLFYVRTRRVFSLLRVGSARLPQASDLQVCGEFALFTPIGYSGISAGHPDRHHLEGFIMVAYDGLRAPVLANVKGVVALPAYVPGTAGDGSLVGKGSTQRKYRFAYAYMLSILADGRQYGDTRVNCGHCGQAVNVSGADVDHCMPGTEWRSNLQLMHVHCNRGRKNDNVTDRTRDRAARLATVGAGITPPVNAVAVALWQTLRKGNV